MALDNSSIRPATVWAARTTVLKAVLGNYCLSQRGSSLYDGLEFRQTVVLVIRIGLKFCQRIVVVAKIGFEFRQKLVPARRCCLKQRQKQEGSLEKSPGRSSEQGQVAP